MDGVDLDLLFNRLENFVIKKTWDKRIKKDFRPRDNGYDIELFFLIEDPCKVRKIKTGDKLEYHFVTNSINLHLSKYGDKLNADFHKGDMSDFKAYMVFLKLSCPEFFKGYDNG